MVPEPNFPARPDEFIGRSAQIEALQKWKLSRLSVGGISLDREGPEFFLTSGTAILKHGLHEAWQQVIRPAQFNAVIFFLDDLHNFAYPGAQGIFNPPRSISGIRHTRG